LLTEAEIFSRISDPEGKKAPDPGSGWIPDPQHWVQASPTVNVGMAKKKIDVGSQALSVAAFKFLMPVRC
jgi:hypothetical protein